MVRAREPHLVDGSRARSVGIHLRGRITAGDQYSNVGKVPSTGQYLPGYPPMSKVARPRLRCGFPFANGERAARLRLRCRLACSSR